MGIPIIDIFIAEEDFQIIFIWLMMPTFMMAAIWIFETLFPDRL